MLGLALAHDRLGHLAEFNAYGITLDNFLIIMAAGGARALLAGKAAAIAWKRLSAASDGSHKWVIQKSLDEAPKSAIDSALRALRDWWKRRDPQVAATLAG